MSQQPVHPALIQPPFFAIPGISPASPISTQIEQVDQQNTLLLQDIDANFARFHQIITAKILPEIKRFAIAGEPTREAAQFWKAFFESAMGVKLPVAGDITGLTPSSPEQTYTEESVQPHSHHDSTQDDYATTSDASFFANGVASSTPRPGGPTRASDSWDDSMESPFDKVDRRLRDDLRIEDGSSEMPTPSLPSGYDLPGLHDVSTGTSDAPDLPRLENTSRMTTTTADAGSTPRAKRNIFQPEPSASNWNGITDLRSTPLNAKFKARSKNTASSLFIPSFNPNPTKPKHSIVNALAELQADMDDEDDINPTMSPPVTMAFNLPPRAQAIYAAGKHTPVKQANYGVEGNERQARGVIDDILEEMASEGSPSMATPEALRRYSVLPPAFADQGSTARQLFPSAQSSSSRQPPPSRRSMANTSFGSDIVDGPVDVQEVEGVEDDSFDDSFDSDGNQTIQPVGVAGQGDLLGDESYMSMSPTPAHAASPTTSEGGMIFGGKAGRGMDANGAQFKLNKVDEMMTFFGGRLEDAALAESPLVGGRAGNAGQNSSDGLRALGREGR